MKVQVRVPMNLAEINKAEQAANEAKALNQKYANQRIQEGMKKKGERVLVPEDVEVPAIPEKVIELKPMLIDASGVEMATIGDAGMIEMLYKGRVFNVEFEREIWETLEIRFDEHAHNAIKMDLMQSGKTCACAN